ncbi:MAG: hypothetical protein JSW11_20015 [Candidatus Heimdallarchaeota archaeon]|nr:MAG: hypothetical protein JSW11_20015 [Candidatus Heimdallarchaeota archaeon]
MPKNSTEKIDLAIIERKLSKASTSSIYDTLSKIQLGNVLEKEKTEDRLDIDLDGFAKHTSLSKATQKEDKKDQTTETIIEPSLSPPSTVQELSIHHKVSIISAFENLFEIERYLLTVAGKEIEFSLKTVSTNRHSEMIKSDINGSDAGIILLPSFTDRNDIQTIINKHVSELWSYNGLGPVPFVILGLEDNITTGSLALAELEQSIRTFIENLTPVTRGNYGFGVKYFLTKNLDSETELRKVLRALSILLISYERFKI